MRLKFFLVLLMGLFCPINPVFADFEINRELLRSWSFLGLLEAKNFVESLPKEIKSDLEKDEADKIVKDLEAAGGEVEVK